MVLIVNVNCEAHSIVVCMQSHYIEVAQGDIFMEQKMLFGLVLGWLAILNKKLGLIMSNF